MPTRIRRAAAEDAEAVRHVAAAAWRDTYRGLLRPATIETFIERAYSVDRVVGRIARNEVHVAEVDGAVAAFAEAAEREAHIELVAIYVLPERRGTGLGTGLLDAIAAGHPSMPMSAAVLVGNDKAEPFYRSRGFHPRETLRDEHFGEGVEERRWWRDPGSAEAGP